MATAVKRKLSASTSGLPILVAASATPGTTIHTAVDSAVAGTFDEIWLYAMNTSTSVVVFTLEYGGTDTVNKIVVQLPAQSGLIPILPGLILQGACIVRAFAATADVITVHGFVNSITD